MFHNSSSAFGPTSSLARTPAKSFIHNDENSFSLKNKSASQNNASTTKGLGLSKSSKTPGKRRTLGDITNKGNGNGQDSNGKVVKSLKKGLSLQTPSIGNTGLKKKSTKKGLSVNSSFQQNTHRPVPSLKKKSTVSFSILSEPDEVEVKKRSADVKKSSAKTLKSRKSRSTMKHPEYTDDIEISAGRLGEEEREWVRAQENILDKDLRKELNELKEISAQSKLEKKREHYPNRGFKIAQDASAIDEGIYIEEEVDEDVLQSYMMFDEYKDLDLELKADDSDFEHDDNPNDQDLFLQLDDLSI